MKKLLFVIVFLFGVIALNAQSYDKSMKVEDFGTFERNISPANKILITSYVTKQKILPTGEYIQRQKTVTDLPKYRYELILISKSMFAGKITKTWIYNAKVFIDSTEMTKQQFPDGFTAIIETTPTVIYWYETNLDTINIKINWKNSIYFRDNN
jgi:hypothetical protein